MEKISASARIKTYTLFSACGIALFFMGVALGFCLRYGEKAKQDASAALTTPAPMPAPTPVQESLTAPVDAIGEKSVHPQAHVVIETVFTSCGHACPAQKESVAGCTEKDLQNRFPDYAVEQFDKDRVVLRHYKAGYCPAHLILTLLDGETAIMQTDAQTLQNERIIDPAWEVAQTDTALLSQLEAGIAFDDLAQIDEFIENLES